MNRTVTQRRRLSLPATGAALTMAVASLVILAPTTRAADAPPAWFTQVPQSTIADTRSGFNTARTKLGAGATRTIQVTGVGGVPDDGSAATVDLLVLATAATTATSLTVHPEGTTLPPRASAITVVPRQTVATTVTVPLSDSGRISVHNAKGTVHLAVAARAWYREQEGQVVAGAGFTGSDSRLVASTLRGTNITKGAIPAGRTRTVTVRGKAGVPADATSVELGLVVTAGRRPVTISAYGASESRPALGSVYVPARRTRTTTLALPLGVGTQLGRVKLTASGGSANVQLVQQGWFGPAIQEDSLRLTGMQPALLADTATGANVTRGPIGAGKSRTVQVLGQAGVPTNARAVVVSVTSSRATRATKVMAYRDGTTRPAVPTLQSAAAETVSTRAVLVPSAAGKIRLFNTAGLTHVRLAVQGWYGVRPPDPGVEDFPLPGSVVEAADALTTGANPRQSGVAAGTLDPERVSILTGEVTVSGTDQPVGGAEVRVLDHPELGQTTTLSDGSYALAVNGGGALGVEVTKGGYLPVQRWAETTWLTWLSVAPMSLTALDTNSATIDPDSATVQVAQGSVETDAAGTRQTTLLFRPGTDAVMRKPDGTTEALGAMTVRSTEYTTGEQGQQAMPGLLPTNTGFTYASEFSVDQALAEGATSVEFSKPVPTYVTNFLNLEAGTTVPAGYYDRELAQWVAGPNGVVLDVVAEPGGVADLDVTGDGVADSGSPLSDLGIDTAERQELARLYAPGDSLTRVAVEHFTPWDYNYPYGPPPGAGGPPAGSDGGPGGGPGGEGERKKRPCQSSGSIILCESRTLQEEIGVAGTPLSLRYSSDSVPGALEPRQVKVRVCDGTTATPPADIRVHIVVAGVEHEEHLAGCPPDDFYTFTWDGKDAGGQAITGRVLANITVGYGYQFVYRTPQEFEQSFAQFGTGTLFTRSGEVAARPELNYIERTFSQQVGFRDERAGGLGGWRFGQVHRYDTERRVLELGDGREVSAADPLSAVVSTIAGSGQDGGGDYDGPALEMDLGITRGIAVGPDGTVYFADTSNGVIRKIDPQGEAVTVAGGGSAVGEAGDGGPATEAALEAPWDVAVTPDGALLIADAGANRIRRVSSGGTISTIAGGGSPSVGVGDGTNARAARLSNPRGITLTPQGSLYIADTGHRRVRMLNPDGSILTIAGGGSPADGVGDGLLGTEAALDRPVDVAVVDQRLLVADALANRVRVVDLDGTIDTFAGNGESGAARDGLPATGSPLSGPTGLAATEDGVVYIADRLHNRIRQVDPSGAMTTAVGTGDGRPAWDEIGDGGLGTRAVLAAPDSVAVSPDGSLIIADSGHFRLRKLATALPGNTASAYALPSADGSEVYAFDAQGRHLQTRDGLTGTVLLELTYDSAGRLASATDVRGRVTTLGRGPAGEVRITAPTGQVTVLARDAQGWLSSVTDPAGEQIRLGHRADGLLTSLTDQVGGVHQFQYDANGRLTRDTNPAGGHQQLTQTDLPRGVEVALTTTTGRTRKIRLTSAPDGVVHRTVIENNGDVLRTEIHPDGMVVSTDEDGGVTRTESMPDPRWGSLVQVPSQVSYTSPSGRVDTRTFTYDVTVATPGSPLPVVRWHRAVDGAGGTVSDEYVHATRTTTRTPRDGVPQVFVADADDQVVSARRGTQPPTTYSWNSLGLLTASTEGAGTPDARTTTWTYDSTGSLASMTDALDRQTTYDSDALGRVTGLTRPDGGVVSLRYDAAGNMIGVTPPGRDQHTIVRADDRVTGYDAPGGAGNTANDRSYTFNQDGLLIGATESNGSTTTFQRDEVGRTTRVSAPDGTDVGYSYADRLLRQVTNAQGADLSLHYDADRRLDGYAWSGPVSGSVRSDRDALLQVTGVTVNGGAPIDYSWNENGTLASAGGLWVSQDPESQLWSGDTAGTVSHAITRNAFGESLQRTYQVGGVDTFATAVTRDDLGRIATRTETVEGVTSTYSYSYDEVDRLIGVTRDGAQVERYTYDRNGNRLTQGTDPQQVTSNSLDQVTSAGADTFGHDAFGRRTSQTVAGETTAYAWSRLAQLRQVTLPDTTVSYVLDGTGRRVGRKVGGSLETGYLYDDQDRLVATTDSTGGVTARFAYNEEQVAPLLMRTPNKTYRLVTDTTGSVRMAIDTATGEIAQRIDYDSFGRVLADSAPGFQPFGFAGGLYDHRTGLVKFGVREYDARTGTWLSQDLIGFSGEDTNLYAYVGNDPVNRVDPSGKIDIPGVDLDLPDFPDIDFPDIKLPSLACVGSIVGLGLDLAANIPGPIGVTAGIAGQTLDCVSEGCSWQDWGSTAVGFVPGMKLATGLNKGYDTASRAGKIARNAGGATGVGVESWNRSNTLVGHVQNGRDGVVLAHDLGGW